ncbi:hypothetical protein OHB35_30175 [Streptomyces phaeochromogenes]|uniref:TIGR04222 domain-containing membrane protein n=1 Tax=Streptomyces phaeochromogenes TaxID=1923 RepID=A0ABZ1HIU7_STRPH|nr:hypothetical protein [Streptomyces phaeochromogenes]WSD17166.1 hypothetical protein OHB35_30175 [Streptomyces phaeochromogenes]
MTGLLPVSGAALSADARLLSSIRDVGARRGVDLDYTDDAATAEMLARHRRTLSAAEHGPLMWLGSLALVAAIVWPFLGHTVPAFEGRPELAFGPAGPLLVVAVTSLVVVRRRWKRELLHPRLAGYREVLGLARAHGVPVTHVPGWLVGRSMSGDRETVPIPAYAGVEPLPAGSGPEPASGEATEATEGVASAAPPAVPAKPASVETYEAMADEGGWHDEAGCLLLFVGIGGVAWAVSEGNALGHLAAVLAVPLAITTWLAGARQGRERQRLREAAVAYVQALSAAQSAGASVPELSPVLRKLLEEEAEKAWG